MKKLMLALLAVGALATATAASASACHGKHKRSDADFRTLSYSSHRDWAGSGAGVVEKLRGSGSSFAAGTASANGSIVRGTLDSGSFTAALATDWSQAKSNDHGGSCAPATGTLSLGDSSSALGTSLKGVTCTVGSNPRNVAAVFFGKADVTTATGSLSKVTGGGRVLLVEKTDGTVKGFEFAGFKGWHERSLAGYSKDDAHDCGWR
jgi:hypothetical protein